MKRKLFYQRTQSPGIRKLCLVMKLTTLFIFGFLIQVSAITLSQNKTMTHSFENSTLVEVFETIEKESCYSIIYKNEIVRNIDSRFNGKFEDTAVSDILNLAFKDESLEYRMVDNVIVILPTDNNLDTSPQKQRILVSGKVLDSNGDPIPGVNVFEKGTTNGTVTNIEGEYVLTVIDEETVLVYSFIGFEELSLSVAGRKEITVTLAEETTGLNEIVVIGYGSRKKETLTGAIATIDAKVFASRPVANAASALQGAVAGLVISSESSRPGDEKLNFTLRGLSSTNGGNSPLILIDGLQGSLTSINPEDIQSMSVLKDGAAAIYGNQAAGGVILVTTKKGKKGKPVVTYKGAYSVNVPTRDVEKLSIKQFLDLSNEARANDGDPIFWGQRFYDAIGTDEILNFSDWELGGAYRADSWLSFNNPDNELWDAVVGTGVRQNHNFSISGGGENSNYYFSLGMLDEEGIIKTKDDDYSRYNGRFNYDYKLNDKLTLSSQTSLEVGNRVRNNQINLALATVANNLPFLPIARPDGERYQFRGFANPLGLLEHGSPHKSLTNRIVQNFTLNYDIIKDLKLTAMAGVNNLDTRDRNVNASIPIYNTFSTEKGGSGNGGYANGGTSAEPTAYRNKPATLVEASGRGTYMNANVYANYVKKINENHQIDLTVGYSHEQNKYNQIWALAKNFATNDLFSLGLGDPDNARINQTINTWTVKGMFARANYVFKDRYYLEGNIRRDESSRFNPDNRAGTFGGAFVAWRLSEESFIKNLNIFDNLKLRASYGETGNQSGIGLYDYLALINNTDANNDGNKDTPIIFGPATGNEVASTNPESTIAGVQNENPFYTEQNVVSLDRTWETIATTNFGIDVSVLNNKLDFTFEYFIKKNKDMLVPITLPSVLGATAPTLNIGELETKGWEISINWKDKIGDFNYSINANIFDAKNKLTNLNGGAVKKAGQNNFLEGYAYGTYFGYKYEGIIQNQEQLLAYAERFSEGGIPNPNAQVGAIAIGDAMYADLDGNKKLHALGDPENGDTGDLVELGNSTPRYNFGLNMTGDYKGFDIRIFVQGTGKRDIFKSGSFASPGNKGAWYYPGMKYWVGKTWTPDNTGANFPALSYRKDSYNYTLSSNTILNGAYVRLKNIQIGYSLPKSVLNHMKLERVRLYLSGENVAMWTAMDKGLNFDPEAGGSSLTYPFMKTFGGGIQVTF